MLATLREMFRFGASASTFTYRDTRAVEVFGGGVQSAAGVVVTKDKALSYSPWWKAIDLVSSAVARNTLAPYRISDDGRSRTVDTSHPLRALLANKPNYFQTSYQFVKLMVSQYMSSGNAYAYILRDGMAPTQLVPLDPNWTTPVIIKPSGALGYAIPNPGDQVWYVWTPEGGSPAYLRSEDVLHFRGLSAEGLWGYSVVTKAKEALGLGLGQQIYSSTFFANGGKPKVVLMHAGKLADATKAALAESWDRRHSGDNAHSTAVLDQGLTAKEMSFSPSDSELIESRKFSIIDVANYTGVPPHKLGDASRAGYNSLEQENLSFREDTLSSHFTQIEQEMSDKLLREDEKDAYDIAFVDMSLRTADLTTKANYVRTLTGGSPVLTKNEGRVVVGFNPIDDPKYDAIPDALNQSTGQDQQQPANDKKTGNNNQQQQNDQPANNNAAIVGAAYRMAHATCKRLATRAAHQAKAAAKTVRDFCDFADGYEQASKATALEEFEPAEDAVRAATGKAPQFASRFMKAVASQLNQIALDATEKTLQSVVAAACGSLADTLGKQIGEQR